MRSIRSAKKVRGRVPDFGAEREEMSIERARLLWQEHLRAPFPGGCRGREVAGVDLVWLDSRVAGYISRRLKKLSGRDRPGGGKDESGGEVACRGTDEPEVNAGKSARTAGDEAGCAWEQAEFAQVRADLARVAARPGSTPEGEYFSRLLQVVVELGPG